MPVQVRISERSKAQLQELAEREKVSMTTLLDEAVDRLVRQRYIEQFNAGYAQLREDPVAWREEQAERAEWDATLPDGLDEED